MPFRLPPSSALPLDPTVAPASPALSYCSSHKANGIFSLEYTMSEELDWRGTRRPSEKARRRRYAVEPCREKPSAKGSSRPTQKAYYRGSFAVQTALLRAVQISSDATSVD
jgi:hypothetical protein